MKYKIIFSENAKSDLISHRILIAIKSLEEFPQRHGLCYYKEWKDKGLRVLPVENYLVFYMPVQSNQTIRIYRVLYAKIDIENQLKDKIVFE